MSVTLVNNSPQLTVATAGTRGLTGAHVVNAEFSGSDLIITLSDGTVVNAGGAILSSSGSNNWVGQQAIDGNVIITGSFILSGSNTLVNIGPASFSGSVDISGSTTITGSLIISGGTINVIGTNLVSASQQITFLSINGATTYTQSVANLVNQSTASLSSSIGALSGSVAGTIDNKIALINETNSTFVSKSIFNTFATSSNTRLTSLEAESSNVRVTLNSYTQSQGLTNLRYEESQSAALQSASLFNDVSASYVISASSLQGSASAQSTRLSIAENRLEGLGNVSGALHQFSQSVSAVTNSLQIATASLFTSASSLKITASNHETRLDAIEYISSSWGASTDVSGLNAFATSSLASIVALQITASSLVAYTTSSDSDINNLELSASSLVVSASSLRTSASTALSTNNSQASSITALNTFSASVNASGSIVNIFTASVNTFTASVNNSLNSLTTISASLLTSASSLATSASLLRTSASSTAGRLNSIEFTTGSLNNYSSSLKNAIDVTDGNLTVIGNLTVQGDTTTLNTTNLIVEDKLIELAKGTTTSVDANGAGIYISGADASITWNNATSKITTNKGIFVTGDISVSGLVDGTDILVLSSSYNTVSGSYNNVSGAINTIINGLNNYTSSSGIEISNLNTISASYLTFTQSYYTNSSSFDERVVDLEASVGGGGTGIATRVTRLETSASLSAVTNSLQSNQLTAIIGQIGLLNSTSSNLAGGAVGTANQLNNLNASASALIESASSLRNSASVALNTNNQQGNKLTLLENFTGSTFINYSQSVSESISQISASIGGGSIGLLVNGLTASVANLTITQSSISSSYDNLSSSYLFVSTSFRNRIDALQIQSASYLDFVSGSRSGSFPSFPPFSASVDQRFNLTSQSIAQLNDSAFLDSDQVTYSASVALVTSTIETTATQLSSSVWNAATGLSRSINLRIQNVSGSITSRINTIVVGTGFIERPEFNSVTSSLSESISALNVFSASVIATGSVINTFTSSVNAFTESVSNYTSSINAILIPTNSGVDTLIKNDLYVSGTITSNRMIVNTTINNITTSIALGDNVFGDTYGDSQTINGITTINGALILNVSSSDPIANPSFVSISADIRVVSGTVIAPIFVGTFDGAFSGSSQTNVSGTTGFSEFTSSISESINAATSSLSSSVSSSIGLLSASVASINASQVATESLNIITSSLYNTTQSLNNSTASLNTFSASVTSSLDIIYQHTGSINSFSESVIATGSIMNTFTESINIATNSLNIATSSLNTYTASLLGAVSVTGSNLRVLGNLNVENDLIVSGNIIAQQYIVSSSVTYMTTSFSSGSTTFGDDAGDTHNFTGSVYVVGNISSSDTITAATHSGHIKADNGVVSSSTQFVEYGGALTSSNTFVGTQTINGVLRVSGSTILTGSVGIDLTGVESGSFQIKNGATRIDSVLFVSDNDYVTNTYVGGDIRVNDYLASGYTAHYDGGVQITGSLNVGAGQNGSGSYFSGSVSITGSTAITENLQIKENTAVSGNFIATTISASSAVTASSLRVEGLTRINGEVDLDTTAITIGAGGNAVTDETRLNTLNLRVDSDTFFNSNVTAISGSTRFKSVAINDLSESRIPHIDATDTLTDNANFTYNGVTFKVGGGRFEVDDATGNIRTSGSLSVGALNILNNLDVAGAVGLQSTLTVTGSTLISSSLRATSTASFGALTVTGSTILGNRLQVGTNAAVSGNLGVSGSVALSSSLFVSGNITASANANITGDVAITGSLNAVGPTIAFGNSMTDNIYLSGNLEITGSLTRNTTNLKAAFSLISTYTQEQAWSASFVSESTLRTPDEYLEYFVGQGSNKRRYITPVWLDETLYADDYFDISVVSGADSDYVF